MGIKISAIAPAEHGLLSPFNLAAQGAQALGAFNDGKLVAACGFISHRLLRDGVPMPAVQCFAFSSAQDSVGQQALLARGVAEAKGAVFAFAVQNETSPLTQETLRESGFIGAGGYVKAKIGWTTKFGHRAPLEFSAAIAQNDHDLLALRPQAKWKPIVFSDGPNAVWGRVSRMHFGLLSLPKLVLGGVLLNRPDTIATSIRSLMATHRLAGVEFEAHESAQALKGFEGCRFHPSGRKLYVKKIGRGSELQNASFNFFGGIAADF